MDEQTNAPRQSPEDRGKARQDSTTPSVHSITTDDKRASPRHRRRHSGRAARPAAQSSAGPRNTLRRRSSSRSDSFGPHGGSSRDVPPTMQRSLGPSEPDAITYTPTTRRVSKAKKGKRVHACEFPGCGKVFTRAEHRRRHELNHSPEPHQCAVAGCQKSFHRPDLLARHMERQHNDPESHRDYRHGRSLSQGSMPESDPAHNIMATTVPPLSPSTMLDAATQPSSTISIYSIVNHNTPPGFVNQSMNTLNDLSQLAAPIGPHGFAPDLVYGVPSDDSPFYSSDSSYSPNPEYSRAGIAGQSYLPRQDRQHSPSFTPHMGPCYQPPLYATSTLPAWYESETGLAPQEPQGPDHFEGSFLQSVGTPHLARPRHEQATDPFLGSSVPIPLSDLDGYEWGALRGLFPAAADVKLDRRGVVESDLGKLNDYLDCYWQHFHPLFPVIHRPTFLASTPPPLLAAAMIAIGAQFSTRSHSKSYSTFMHEACIKLLSTQRDPITSRSRVPDLQTIILLEIFSKYRSRRADVHMSSRFRVMYSSFLRDRDRLLTDPMLPLRNIPKQTNYQILQAAWHRWIDHEARRRIFLSAFILETQQVALTQQTSQNRHVITVEHDLPFPCESMLWESGAADKWSLNGASERTCCLTEGAAMALSSGRPMDLFQSTTVLCHFVSNQNSEKNSDKMLFILQGCLHDAKNDSLNRGLLIYHALVMAQKTPIAALLTVSGESWIFGHKLSEEADFHASKATLRAWADDTDNSSRAVWHATALLRGVMSNERSTYALHEQWSIYIAALVCWAFGFVARPGADPLTGPWDLTAEMSVEEQEMWAYLSAMDKPSWELLADVPLRWHTAGLLDCVRRRISGPMGGLLNEAQSVLARLFEGVSTLAHF